MAEMAKFRAREVIEAAQWHKPGDLSFVVPYDHIAMTHIERAYNREKYGTVYNGCFGYLVEPGDWVSRKNGQFFVYSDESFRGLYARLRA